jgi:hypothetical protein
MRVIDLDLLLLSFLAFPVLVLCRHPRAQVWPVVIGGLQCLELLARNLTTDQSRQGQNRSVQSLPGRNVCVSFRSAIVVSRSAFLRFRFVCHAAVPML